MFAHPEALWLLAAAPLPVLLHLLGTARPRDLVFPGVYLLRQMAARRRAVRLRYLLLLLLRTAALAAAAIVAAGPRSLRPLPLLSSPGTPVLFLDASASMGSGEGTAWRQAIECAQLLAARQQRPQVIISPPQHPGSSASRPIPAQPSPSQGALADAVTAAIRQGLALADAPLYVITDLDASSVLPRRWPPGSLPVAAAVIACARPAASIYAVRPRPPQPTAGLPVTLACYLRPSRQETLLRASAKGVPPSAARAAPGTCCALLPLGTLAPGVHTLEISAGPWAESGDQGGQGSSQQVLPTARKYRLRVRDASGVAVVADARAARFLVAAVDPWGTGRPFFVSGLAKAQALIADGTASPPAGFSFGGGVLLFAGPKSAQWLHALGLQGELRPTAPLSAEQALRLRTAADAPPAWRPLLEIFRPTLESASFFRPARLQLGGDWWVLARFSDGAPALAWSEAGQQPVLVLAFPPAPDATDLVSSGAFAAFILACLTEMLPPEAPPPSEQADNPPPAELAGVTATAGELRAAWGTSTTVVDFTSGMELPEPPSPADVTPILSLLGLALLGCEWLLGRRLSGA